MVCSTKDNRVAESKSLSQSQSGPGGLGKRKRGKEDGQGLPTPKPLLRVERTNALPVNEFIKTYVPQSSLEIQTPDQKRSDDTHKDDATIYALDIYSAKTIPESDFQSCFDLLELTSSKDYANSSVGWSPSKKRKEMKLPDMRYIVLRQRERRSEAETQTKATDGGAAQTETAVKEPVLGFLSSMVTYEDGKEVIYCYEIHLSPALQGKGLGKHLMKLYEEIGRRVGLEKAMLTVFKSNSIGTKFYENLGYEVDEYSPQPRRLRNGTIKEPDYVILSKPLDMSGHETNQGNSESAGQ